MHDITANANSFIKPITRLIIIGMLSHHACIDIHINYIIKNNIIYV